MPPHSPTYIYHRLWFVPVVLWRGSRSPRQGLRFRHPPLLWLLHVCDHRSKLYSHGHGGVVLPSWGTHGQGALPALSWSWNQDWIYELIFQVMHMGAYGYIHFWAKQWLDSNLFDDYYWGISLTQHHIIIRLFNGLKLASPSSLASKPVSRFSHSPSILTSEILPTR